jgi:hypothetical protein
LLLPRYNIAATQAVRVVGDDGKRYLVLRGSFWRPARSFDKLRMTGEGMKAGPCNSPFACSGQAPTAAIISRDYKAATGFAIGH